jgi:hypothetical protein
VTFINLLIFAVCGLQAEPAPAKAHRLRDPEIVDLFQEILRGWRSRCFIDGCGDRGPWFPPVEFLFTLAYPEKSERFAQELLEDPESTVPDRHFALNLLPRLSRQTSQGMESLLVGLVDHLEVDLADAALEKLSSLYGLSRHRALFREHCTRGCPLAFEVLAYEVNPETIRFLEDLEIREKGQDPRFDSKRLSIQAHEALERIKILASTDWMKRIEVLLSKEEPDGRQDWAEQVATRKAPEVGRAYYKRKVEVDRKRLMPLLGRPDGESFGRRFLDSWDLKEATSDFNFNLLALADWGGELTPLEKLRLTRFGLLGNAEPRLIEIMKVRIPSPK